MKMKTNSKALFAVVLSALVMMGSCLISDARGRDVNDEYDIFLLIGQSNMAGRGYMIEGDQEVYSENVFLLNDKGEIEPASNPLNKYSSIRKDMKMQRINPGFSFSKKIAEQTGRKILLVVNARGGSSINEWMPGAEKGYYEEAVRRTMQAMQYPGELKAILWHQGCSDSRDRNYMKKLADMVSSLRNDLDAQNVPFIAGELAYWRSTFADFNSRISGISKYIHKSDYVSAKDCNMLIDENDPHFGRDGQILLGERYADKVMKMCYSQEARESYSYHWYVSPEGNVLPYRSLEPMEIRKGKKYPLVLLLHDAGKKGSDNETQLLTGAKMFQNPVNREKFPAFVLIPQCPKGKWWTYDRRPDDFDNLPYADTLTTELAMVKAVLDEYLKKPEVDKSRIYVMGASMGGVGTYDIVAHYPEIFAAAVPICGAIAQGHISEAKDVSFWIFHGDDDATVPVTCSRRAYRELKEVGADVIYREIPSGKHGINFHVYNTPGFMEWLFSNKRR